MNDANGIIWPMNVAPFQVYLASIGSDEKVLAQADKLYKDLEKAGIEVLYDDRKDSPGVKLKDADLIGIPLRLVISNRTLEKESVEWKARTEKDFKLESLTGIEKKIKEFINK
jgi:prolyl-tRNA synthetase